MKSFLPIDFILHCGSGKTIINEKCKKFKNKNPVP